MINLITGTPGSGKTAYALKFMLDQIKIKGSRSRKLYVHGIPNLKLPHEKVFCRSKNCDLCSQYDLDDLHPSLFADNWHLYAPDGAVYFFDECQNIYRPRPSGSQVPDSVASFEVHRHKGLDFFMITQSPKLIDTNVRELVSRHIHLKVTWAGRFQYEWPETKLNTQATTDAIKSSYKLDKSVFKLYHSASVHTKQKRRVPIQLYFLVFALVMIGFFLFRGYSKFHPDMVEPELFDRSISSGGGGEALASTPPPSGDQIEQTTDLSTDLYDLQTLSRLSFSVIDSDRLPAFCYPVSGGRFHCVVPSQFANLFKISFCVSNHCFAVLKPSLADSF